MWPPPKPENATWTSGVSRAWRNTCSLYNWKIHCCKKRSLSEALQLVQHSATPSFKRAAASFVRAICERSGSARVPRAMICSGQSIRVTRSHGLQGSFGVKKNNPWAHRAKFGKQTSPRFAKQTSVSDEPNHAAEKVTTLSPGARVTASHNSLTLGRPRVTTGYN